MATSSVGHNNTPQCDNCREAGVVKDAVSFCSECDSHFCVVCDKLHGKIAPGHKTDIKERADIVDEKTKYALCSKHRKETVEYYCQTHESVFCETCKLSEHAICAVQSISDACEGTNISKDICDMTEQLIKLQEATDRLKWDKQMTLNAYQSDMGVHRDNIKNLRKKFSNMFERYDKQLESQETTTVNNLSSSIRSCVLLSDQLKEQTKSFEEKQDVINKQSLFQQLINARKTCTEFRSVFEEIRSKKAKCGINIKQDKNHQTLLDQLYQLVHQDVVSEEYAGSEEVADDATNGQPKTFINIKSCPDVKEVNVRVHNDESVPHITGSCWLPDGQVILCDYQNKKIKILDKDFNIKFAAPCPTEPWDVDYIDESSAVVAMPNAKALQFISIKPGFKFQQKRDLNLSCRGVSVHDKNIFVCIDESEPSKWGVKILNLNGNDVAFISHIGAGDPRKICVTADGTKVCYTGGSGNDLFINCVTKDGYGIFSVSSSELGYPRGIVRDECNNIMVCDGIKKCVQIICPDGVCGNVLLTDKNNMYSPTSMCLSKTYDNLIVASYKYVSSGPSLSKLTVYKLEYS